MAAMARARRALGALIFGGGWFFLMACETPQTKDALIALLPAEVRGWTAEDSDRVYAGEGIFEYIDGAGEVYRAYNYQKLVARRYKKAAVADITVDLFDMGSSPDAFGVFTHDLEGEPWPVGQDGLYKNGLLQFWRDRYFVSIYAEAETSETRAAVADLGKRIAEAIGADGPRPDLLDRLPADFRSGGAVRYLHSPVILNYHFFVSRENVLQLDLKAEAVLAAKGEKNAKRFLLLIRYPAPEKAEAAARGFFAAFLPEAKAPAGSFGQGFVRTDAGLWTGAAREGTYLVVIFNAAAEAEARTALAASLAKLGPSITVERRIQP
jgi:hypothetical protein